MAFSIPQNPPSSTPEKSVNQPEGGRSGEVRLGLIKCVTGSVQKRFELIDGQAIKNCNHFQAVQDGLFNDIAVEGLEGLGDLLKSLKSDNCITLGVCDREGKQRLLTGDALAQLEDKSGAIARNKAHLNWPSGDYFLLLDHDPEPGKPKLTAEQFWAALLAAMPELAGVGRLVTSSTSSHLYNGATGDCLRGDGGHHTYIQVRGEVDRFVDLLKVRCWLNGEAFYKLGSPNSQTGVRAALERFLLDISVFSPERIIYEAGALCGEGLEQRRPDPAVYPGAVLDLDKLPIPTEEERQASAELRDSARNALKPEQVASAIEHYVFLGQSRQNATKSAYQALRAQESGKLTPFHKLELQNGEILLAKDLSDKHVGLVCRDPQEPDYRSGAWVAKIYRHENKKFFIHSFCHGSTKYWVQTETEWFIDKVTYRSPKTEELKLHPASTIANALATIWDKNYAYNVTTETFWHYGIERDGLWSEQPEILILQAITTALNETSVGYGGELPSSILKLLKSSLAVSRKWVCAPGVLPFRNGVLCLSTSVLEPHSRENFLCWQLPYEYNPLATCEPIQTWLSWTQYGDQQRVQLLRAWAKACVTGRTDLQRFLEMVGPGGTGKTTFQTLMMALVGSANTHTTELRKLESNRFETANIYGKRLICVGDSSRYGGEMEVFKSLTGQSPLAFERKYKQETPTFISEALVILCANEPIVSSDYTSGLERRRLTIPFLRRVEPTDRRDLITVNNDGSLSGEFAQYLPGLLNWALALSDIEMRDLIVNTANSVPSLSETKTETLLASNPLADWFDSRCVFLPGSRAQIGVAAKQRVTKSDVGGDSRSWEEYGFVDEWLYPNYREYCDRSNIKPISVRRFGDLLVDLCQNQLKNSDVWKDRDRDGAFIMGVALRGDKYPDLPCPISGQIGEGEAEELEYEFEFTEAELFDDLVSKQSQNAAELLLHALKNAPDGDAVRKIWFNPSKYSDKVRLLVKAQLNSLDWGKQILTELDLAPSA